MDPKLIAAEPIEADSEGRTSITEIQRQFLVARILIAADCSGGWHPPPWRIEP
jgi:hypothetical protein